MDFKGQEFSIPAIFNASVCRESLCRVALSENMLYHGILQIHRLIIIFSMTIWGHPPFSDKLMLLVSFPPGTILTIHTIHSQRLHTSSTQIVYTNRLHKSFTQIVTQIVFSGLFQGESFLSGKHLQPELRHGLWTRGRWTKRGAYPQGRKERQRKGVPPVPPSIAPLRLWIRC